jgi:hypothetical protein
LIAVMAATAIVHGAHPFVEGTMVILRAEAAKTPGAPLHDEYVYLGQNAIEAMTSPWTRRPGSERLNPTYGPGWIPARRWIADWYHYMLGKQLVPPTVTVTELPGDTPAWKWAVSLEGHPCGPWVICVETRTLGLSQGGSASLWRQGVMYAQGPSLQDLALQLLGGKVLSPAAFLYVEHYLRTFAECCIRTFASSNYDVAVLAKAPRCPAALQVFAETLSALSRQGQGLEAVAARARWFQAPFKAALAAGWHVSLYAGTLLRVLSRHPPVSLMGVALLLAAGLDPDGVQNSSPNNGMYNGVYELSTLCGAKAVGPHLKVTLFWGEVEPTWPLDPSWLQYPYRLKWTPVRQAWAQWKVVH